MVTDRVGDFIIRLKNAGAIGKEKISMPYSKHVEEIANKLKSLGYVGEVTKGKAPYTFEVTLAYDERGQHKIRGVKRISKPGRRLYTPAAEAHSVKNGIGARLISTPRGVLTDREARKVRSGGEDLFEIW
ncbi:30S ribosomal protein S8 [Patescibacteria group bacterium]|nr:30S ribosomal protein S8 [Patescibacteria group bacterium]MBU1500555.1 30S ribosomal protein S8 [Patescibacteria group bacterium]MBU2080444.1 30S ribosomal protein S8 [Patescibacteria group bacterium]MBU2123751.1 30S ribosomal protein S8 [Patescibacteria group bacterium]MBU2194607.1 30S ribosomal protein S8 [Patescibacteria group bacterium]